MYRDERHDDEVCRFTAESDILRIKTSGPVGRRSFFVVEDTFDIPQHYKLPISNTDPIFGAMGTISEPILLEVDDRPRVTTIGKTSTYFRVSGTPNEKVTISIPKRVGEVDLLVYSDPLSTACLQKRLYAILTGCEPHLRAVSFRCLPRAVLP